LLFCGVGGVFGPFVVGWFVCGVWLQFVRVEGVVGLMGCVVVNWVGPGWVVVVFGGVALLELDGSPAVWSSFSVSDSDVTSVRWL